MTMLFSVFILVIAYTLIRIFGGILVRRGMKSEFAAMCLVSGTVISFVGLLPLLGINLWSFSRGRPMEIEHPIEASAAVLAVAILLAAVSEFLKRLKTKSNKQ